MPNVINGTGTILHTNLGRAIWSHAAIDAAVRAASGYLLLEIDRDTGRRAERFPIVSEYLCELTGAEAAVVTNNNAAALTLAVRLAGRGGGVAIARGELLEIGGGVRIPELIKRSGARLVEVGTTNKTRPSDFEEVLVTGSAKMVLRVHASNFRMEGFVEAPAQREVAKLAAQHGVPLVNDLGSGALLSTEEFGLAHEPTPREALTAGADLVTFSGDKLVGGPQAGLVVGRRDLVERIRRDPLARAMRLDKVSLAALVATLDIYRRGDATKEIPVWTMVSTSLATLQTRARLLQDRLKCAEAASCVIRLAKVDSVLGGGSLPADSLPSIALAIQTPRVNRLARALRRGRPAVLGRISRGELLLDLRTIVPAEDAALVDALAAELCNH